MGDIECDRVAYYYSSYIDYYDYLFQDHLKASEKLLTSLLARLRANKVTSVLDACCGSGHDVEFFLKSGFNVDAADLCQHMIEYTRRRVQYLNISNSIFFQSDVLELDTKAKRTYDLVTFRGNTLGHLTAPDQIKAVKQLYKRTKPGKFLLFDFRDGHAYFKERKSIELRGRGIDRIKHVIYFSLYNVTHPRDFSHSYAIHSKVFLFDYDNFSYKKKSLKIDGYYVDTLAILKLLSQLKCSFELIESGGKGLPYLKTILLRKGA